MATFPDNIGNLPVTTCSEIDAVATTLWNLCTRSARNTRDIGQYGAEQYTIFDDTILLAKTFSFLLLDCTRYHERCNTSDIARLMKVALRTAKTTLSMKYTQELNNIAHLTLHRSSEIRCCFTGDGKGLNI